MQRVSSTKRLWSRLGLHILPCNQNYNNSIAYEIRIWLFWSRIWIWPLIHSSSGQDRADLSHVHSQRCSGSKKARRSCAGMVVPRAESSWVATTDCLPTEQHTSIVSLLIQNIYTAVWHTRCWGDEFFFFFCCVSRSFPEEDGEC